MNEKNSVYRTFKLEPFIREGDGSDRKKMVLRGYPVVFNVEAKIWDWWYGEITEIVEPTAFDGVDLSNVLLLGGHKSDPDHVLGKNGINMRLEVDEIGLFFEVDLPNTQYARDVYNVVEMELVDGMSCGFFCSDEVNSSTLVRKVTHYDEFLEITITPFPAYKEASVIAIQERELKKREAEEKRQKALDEQEAEEKRQKELAREDKLRQLEEL